MSWRRRRSGVGFWILGFGFGFWVREGRTGWVATRVLLSVVLLDVVGRSGWVGTEKMVLKLKLSFPLPLPFSR